MELATKADFDCLQKKVEELTECIRRMSSSLSLPDVLYVSDIARMEDLSISGIKKSPWLLPDFGRSEYPEGRCRWTTRTVNEWRSIPVATRISMWRTHQENRQGA